MSLKVIQNRMDSTRQITYSLIVNCIRGG